MNDDRQASGEKTRERRVIFIVPAVPWYRLEFFQRMKQRYPNSAVYSADVALPGFETGAAGDLVKKCGEMRRLPLGLFWHSDITDIDIARGDVLVVTGEPRVLSLVVVLAKARLRGAKIIWWGHYWGATNATWRFLLRSLFMTVCDGVAVYTDAERCAAQTNPLLRREIRIAGLNNGMPQADVIKFRADFDPALRERRILFIGRLTEKSSLELLLSALATRALAGVILDVVGAGPIEAELKVLARKLGIEDRVVWHGSVTDEPQIAVIANKARIFVYPGAVGLSLIHAMAYGLPAVIHGSYREHMPEIAAFYEEVTGRTFKKGSADDLATAISKTIDSEEFLRCSSEAARQVSKLYGPDIMSTRMTNLIEGVAGAPG